MRVCAGGDLLAQLLVAQPEVLVSLADPAVLEGRRTRADFRAALASVFAPGLGAAEQRDRLRRIKQAQELTVVWRYLLGVTDVDRYSREMTALAEATLAAGWLMALGAQVERHGVPRDTRGRFVPAVIVGLGKLGGRELTTGSDLDLFVTFGRADAGTADGETDGPERVDAHTFYSGAVERLAHCRLEGTGRSPLLCAVRQYRSEYAVGGNGDERGRYRGARRGAAGREHLDPPGDHL